MSALVKIALRSEWGEVNVYISIVVYLVKVRGVMTAQNLNADLTVFF